MSVGAGAAVTALAGLADAADDEADRPVQPVDAARHAIVPARQNFVEVRIVTLPCV